MAESKDGKVIAKVDGKSVSSEREGLVTSWVSHSAELAERTAVTAFGIVRDVQNELNQRVLGLIALVDGTQQGLIKLVRGIDDRLDKLSEDVIDAAESVTLGVIRTVRDTGHGVTDLASGLTSPRETTPAPERRATA
jgi:hypothetical protein